MAEGACDASHVPSLPFFLTLPPFPPRPSGGACAGAPRPLPGVVAHGRGCVRRQPRPFPFFLTLPPFPLRPSGGACAGAPRPLPGVVAHGRGCVRRQPRPFPSFLSDSSSLPSPSFWAPRACAGAPRPRPLPGVVAHGRGCVRRQPRPFPSFLSDSSSLPSPSFWGCVCWCSTSSAWSGGPWQRVRATPATSLPFLSF